jgi:hypothetical protein
MTHQNASCSCGQLTAKVTGEPIRVAVCHCHACQRRPDSIGIPVGAFADSNFPAPIFSVYEERMHAWVSLPEGIEHMA